MERNPLARSASRRRWSREPRIAGLLAYLAVCASPMLAYLGCGGRSDLEVTAGFQGEGGALAVTGDPDAGESGADAGKGDAADAGDAELVDVASDAETGPSCTDACTQGDSECQPEGVSTCGVGADGCTDWGAPVTCAANQTCQVSGTKASCACEPGTVFIAGACTAVPPGARPIAPLSTATVTSQQPLFHWVLARGEDGAQVDICRDRACTQEVTTFTALGTSGSPTTSLTAGLYYWRLHGMMNGVVETQTSSVWEFVVGARSAPVNTSWGTMLDVNGDGFADLFVGAGDTSNLTTGGAYLYLGGGSVKGSAWPPTVIVHGLGSAGGQFGSSVASAGDVNGDGFADVVVGAPEANSHQGSAYIYLGSPTGLSATPTTLTTPAGKGSTFGSSVANAGDVNGDGYADVVIGADGANGQLNGSAYVYLGSASGLSPTPSAIIEPSGGLGSDALFGHAVSAGDVNGDGFGDLVIGGAGGDGGLGNAYVYLGGAGGLSATPTQIPGSGGAGGMFGWSVASADVNGDGFADVVVGAFGVNEGVGSAYVYLGGVNGLSLAPTPLSGSGAASAEFGWSVASAGDVNGDGFADVIVGEPQGFSEMSVNSHEGNAYLYLGGAGGLSTTPTKLIGLAGIDGAFGISVAGAGDVDGDGFADVVIGASGSNVGGFGAAFVFFGGAGGLAGSIGIPAPNIYRDFGGSVAHADEACGVRFPVGAQAFGAASVRRSLLDSPPIAPMSGGGPGRSYPGGSSV